MIFLERISLYAMIESLAVTLPEKSDCPDTVILPLTLVLAKVDVPVTFKVPPTVALLETARPVPELSANKGPLILACPEATKLRIVF